MASTAAFCHLPSCRNGRQLIAVSLFRVLGCRAEQGALTSASLSYVGMEAKLLLSGQGCLPGRVRWALTPGCPVVCGELCVGCDVAVVWGFCFFRVLFWTSTWRPSLWARQSLRSTCWWDILLESCWCFCPMCCVHCGAEHFVPFAGQLFPVASVRVSRWVQGLSFANSAEIPATESWERNWKWVCHLSALPYERAWAVVP